MVLGKVAVGISVLAFTERLHQSIVRLPEDFVDRLHVA
jgi:hypothetical protein